MHRCTLKRLFKISAGLIVLIDVYSFLESLRKMYTGQFYKWVGESFECNSFFASIKQMLFGCTTPTQMLIEFPGIV